MTEDQPIGYKLILTYDVNGETLNDYHRFIMGKYIPTMQNLGMQIREAWHTAYGSAPNRLLTFVCEERHVVNDLMKNSIWLDLNEELENYVEGLTYKVVRYRDQFQM